MRDVIGSILFYAGLLGLIALVFSPQFAGAMAFIWAGNWVITKA